MAKTKDVDGMISVDLSEVLKSNTLPSPIDYQYYKCLENNTILINQEISECLVEYAIIPLMNMDADENVKHIDILINTVGGDIYTGFSMVSVLEKLKTETTIRIIGMAASMGGLIAMAKNPNLKVVCDKWSVGLIHSGSQYMEGSAHAVKDTFKFSERYEEKIKAYILSHTKISEEMYREIERQEFWMDADDMLKYGIVDEII